ncbi:lysozyme [Alteraurantiacibacter aquimixticola]|uniref:Lysozyme n=1 Tax=Alteraurantiacibacter aquimixticola TaxID=2489173 RepID=A0A4V4U8U5_9SPHN|nr:lysozyme [Alteraurantiacibacter aquimixticola]TIX51347.1 lysozyme [Alteraurantiacibacter aquimixticola]
MNRKPLFDTVRTMLGRGFRQSEVDAIDHAVDDLREDSVPSVPSSSPAPRVVGPDGIALIRQFEGCAKRRQDGMVEAYPDPGTGGDPWTIGWGATGKGIGPGTMWTQAQCDARLEADLARYAGDVVRAIGDAPTSQAQFDAMVSFHYNTGAIGKATLTRKHVAGDHAGAAREFDRWVNAGGRVMKGLVRRRVAEAALYRKG